MNTYGLWQVNVTRNPYPFINLTNISSDISIKNNKPAFILHKTNKSTSHKNSNHLVPSDLRCLSNGNFLFPISICICLQQHISWMTLGFEKNLMKIEIAYSQFLIFRNFRKSVCFQDDKVKIMHAFMCRFVE